MDWPSSENKVAIDAGMQALMLEAMNAGNELCTVLGDDALAAECKQMAEKMKKASKERADALLKIKIMPYAPGNKEAAALLSLSGLMNPKEADQKFLSVGGAKGFSTFYGYYMLRAMALAGNYKGALDMIRQFWGAMLDLGATTFWEDFNMDWLPNAARIDDLVPAGKVDIHKDYGAYCYKGYRHSLCHDDGTMFAPVPAGNWARELPLQTLASVGWYGFYTQYYYSGDSSFIATIYDRLHRYLHADATRAEKT